MMNTAEALDQCAKDMADKLKVSIERSGHLATRLERAERVLRQIQCQFRGAYALLNVEHQRQIEEALKYNA